MSRWSTLLMDEAAPAEMHELPVNDVLHHAELVSAQQLKPLELYRRWERQQWSATDIPLSADRESLRTGLSSRYQAIIEQCIATFVVGEYTALDMLGPILAASPDEQYSIFLGTQIADEARHTHLVFRLGTEVLEMDPDPTRMLTESWSRTSAAHRELSLIESELVGDLQGHPGDYSRWLKAVTVFHLVTEGVLALVGQRVIIHALRGLGLFDGITSAFTAMCRDESRHVSFGLHALRTGIRDGFRDDIHGVLERVVPVVLKMDETLPGSRFRLRDMSIDALVRHLTSVGVDPAFQHHLLSSVDSRPARFAG